MSEFLYKYVDDETYCLIKYIGNDEHVVIPDTYCGRPVTIINDDIFKGHKEIKSIKLPAGLKALGGFVFDGCESLHETELPDGLTDIWQYAFVRSGIRRIRIPGSVKYIIPYVFKDCRNLTRFEAEEGLAKIYNNAFSGCINLKEVCIHEGTDLSEKAFDPNQSVKVIVSSGISTSPDHC